jgi:hypothetical protein
MEHQQIDHSQHNSKLSMGLVDNQKKIDGYLLAASIHHFKAITHREEGNYKKASQCEVLAKEYLNLANELKG